MAYTKRQLITQAFGELALAGYEFDITPEEQQDAARQLEVMLAEWAPDINLGYRFALDPSGIDLDTDSGLPLAAVRTVYLGLAISMAAGNGKQLAASTIQTYNAGRGKLLRQSAFPPEQQLPGSMPRGAGAKALRSTELTYLPTPDTGPLQTDSAGGLTFGSN